MTDYGKYILEEVESIKEKNALIKNSKLDYKSFNEYRIMMTQIENFNLNQHLSDSEFLRKLNDFIAKADNLFESIILKNDLRKESPQKSFFDTKLDEDLCFLEALKQIKLFSQRAFTKDELRHFSEELENLILDKNFTPTQSELLKQSLLLFKEELNETNESTESKNIKLKR